VLLGNAVVIYVFVMEFILTAHHIKNYLL